MNVFDLWYLGFNVVIELNCSVLLIMVLGWRNWVIHMCQRHKPYSLKRKDNPFSHLELFSSVIFPYAIITGLVFGSLFDLIEYPSRGLMYAIPLMISILYFYTSIRLSSRITDYYNIS